LGRLKDKVAVITGGASGIGEATVKLFIDEGARVAFSDHDKQRGLALSKEIKSKGSEVLFVNAKMELEEQALSFVKRAADHFGQLDILVNNVAMRMFQTVVEASQESWDRILSFNVKSYAFCAKAAIPLMIKGVGGSIINIASNNAFIAGINTVQYDTTKSAITGLTRGMARAHSEEGIRVNAVCPGPTFTPFHMQRAKKSGIKEEEFKEEFARPLMIKRPGTPKEIAACILFWLQTNPLLLQGHFFLLTVVKQQCNN
jgi:NAD(P)-dependent dehydrogenase (short-subunit alcohol dehydrogenase family)